MPDDAPTADPDLTVTLEHLCRLEAQLGARSVIGPTPSGIRTIVEVTGVVVEGARLRGHLYGPPAGDWLTVGPDGTATLDVRLTVETDDGALIHVRYGGRSERVPENPYNYVAAVFETGDERYAWLNKIQAVGKGLRVEDRVLYELYQVR
jgi:Protein of unknown function (DUF3237)